MDRIIPEIPEKGAKMRLIIDTDAANEIDDLYAISLAIMSSQRFDIEGIIATHYAATPNVGPESIDNSYNLICQLLKEANLEEAFPVKKGGHPMQYQQTPSDSEACDFIIERAHAGSENDPLWVLILGAATNPASALLKDPSIANKVRFIFHARSEYSWPERTEQYNVKGDVLAIMSILSSSVPLVWFDTGTNITSSYSTTEEHVAPYGNLGKFIHNYRNNDPSWKTERKGFFDLGDVAWLIEPDICQVNVEKVMSMDHALRFNRDKDLGEMLRVHDIDCSRTWEILFSSFKDFNSEVRYEK